MVDIIARIVNTLANLIVLLVIVNSILSYFLNPYHPVRNGLDRVLQPLLASIRRAVPLVGMFDLSPLILIILVKILSSALISLFYAL